MTEKRYDLLNGTVWKKILVFLLPIALGNIIQQFYNAADGLIVGRFIGTEALAAVGGSAAQITGMIVSFFISFSGGASVKLAQLFGGGRYKEVRYAIGNIVAVCTVIGIAVTVVGVVFAPQLLTMLRTPEDTMADSVIYLRIYLSGAVFILILNIESSILRAIGDSRTPFVYMIICCVTNIVLDFVMVVTLGWGVAGAALATVVSQVINALLLTWKLRHLNGQNLLDVRTLKLKGPYLGAMLKMGLPSGGQSTVYSISNMVMQVGVNKLGTVVVASWAMSGKVDGLFWSLTSAVGIAITTFTGQNYGAGKKDRLRQCARQGYIMATMLTLVTSALLLLSGRFILNILTPDQAVVETTYTVMKGLVPFYFIWTIIEVFGGMLKGFGEVLAPVLITCIGVGVFRILWMVVIYPLDPGIPMLLVNYVISWTITAVALFLYYKRIKPRVLGEN